LGLDHTAAKELVVVLREDIFPFLLADGCRS